MNKILLFCVVLLLTACQEKTTNKVSHFPEPTERGEGKEDEENHIAREEWMAQLHQAAPGVDWKAIEAENTKALADMRVQLRKDYPLEEQQRQSSTMINGIWRERGPSNQAGSVFVTDYDKESNEIHLISAGQTLWRGSIDGNDWEVVNQDYRFDVDMVSTNYIDGKRRIAAAIAGKPHYSDDEGATWTAAEGVNTKDVYNCIKNKGNEIILIARNYNDFTGVYMSKDGGAQYTSLATIFTKDRSITDMSYDKKNDQVYIIEQTGANASKLHTIVRDSLVTLNAECTIGFGEGRSNITSHIKNDSLWLYAYKRDKKFYSSVDTGKTWQLFNELPTRPWSIGVYASSYNPDVLLYGEVEAYRQVKKTFWNKVNNWYDYYNNVLEKLHADMMYMDEFEDQDGKPFLLLSNHGGLSISYDFGATFKNISIFHLNVAQFYDAKTDPNKRDLIFCGSQDQGFQRGYLGDDNIITMEQVVSGDYGHIQFSNQGKSLWTIYPFGSISYYNNSVSKYALAGYTIESDDESVWIPPMTATPDPNEDAVYVAGGNVNGGPGTHIIKLNFVDGSIKASQLPYDFKSSGGEVSAIAFSPFDPDHIYTLTTNGVFYKSTNGGNSFQRRQFGLSGGHYLYGSCILPSVKDPNTIYVSGSGYSNSPVFVSYNGGQSFERFDDGMPSTTVFKIVADPLENYLFAATEAGPYYMKISEGTWQYLGGTEAPNTRFWSLEYVPESQTVRYGTYGRGVWDFVITDDISSTSDEGSEVSFDVYPNPVADVIHLSMPDQIENYTINIYDEVGRSMGQYQNRSEIDMTDLTNGKYFIRISSNGNVLGSKLIVKQ